MALESKLTKKPSEDEVEDSHIIVSVDLNNTFSAVYEAEYEKLVKAEEDGKFAESGLELLEIIRFYPNGEVEMSYDFRNDKFNFKDPSLSRLLHDYHLRDVNGEFRLRNNFHSLLSFDYDYREELSINIYLGVSESFREDGSKKSYETESETREFSRKINPVTGEPFLKSIYDKVGQIETKFYEIANSKTGEQPKKSVQNYADETEKRFYLTIIPWTGEPITEKPLLESVADSSGTKEFYNFFIKTGYYRMTQPIKATFSPFMDEEFLPEINPVTGEQLRIFTKRFTPYRIQSSETRYHLEVDPVTGDQRIDSESEYGKVVRKFDKHGKPVKV